MPHYKDGTEAKVGDLVKGVTYNRGGKVIVGELIQIAPATESCNCIVVMAERSKVPGSDNPDMAAEISKFIGDARLPAFYTPVDGIADGTAKPLAAWLLHGSYDYGAVKDLDLVHRPES